MYSKPTAPRSIGGVIDGSFSLWLAALKKVWLFIFIPQLIASLNILVQYPSLTIPIQPQDVSALGRQSLASSVLSIVVGLISLAFYNGLIARTDDVASHGVMAFGAALGVGFKRWARTLLAVVIMVIAALPLGIFSVLVSMDVAAGRAPSLSLVKALFMLVYALVLVFLLGRVFLTLPVIMVEGRQAWASIRASWNLTRGHWWRCATILTVLFIIAYAVFFLAGLSLGIFGVKSGFRLDVITPKVLLGSQAVSLVFTTLTTPLILAGFMVMYYDLKLRREGGDLAGRVDALAVNKT